MKLFQRLGADWLEYLVHAVLWGALYKSVLKYLGVESSVFIFASIVMVAAWWRALTGSAEILRQGRIAVWLLISWTFVLFVAGVYRSETRVAFTGLSTFVLYPLLWIGVVCSSSRVSMDRILKSLVWATVIMAAFGIYQYHFDRELWVNPHTLYGDTLMLSLNPQVSLRATSFIGSPQNLAFLIVVAMPFIGSTFSSRAGRALAWATVLYGGILSGSGTLGVGLLAYGAYRLWVMGSARGLFTVFSIVFAVVGAYLVLVVVSLGEGMGEHPLRGIVTLGLEDHLPFYQDQLANTSDNIWRFLVGRGLGHADRLVELFAPTDWVAYNESHALRVLYETGLIGSALLIGVGVVSLWSIRRIGNAGLRGPMAFSAAMVYANAMATPVLSGFTGSIVGSLFIVYPLIAETVSDRQAIAPAVASRARNEMRPTPAPAKGMALS